MSLQRLQERMNDRDEAIDTWLPSPRPSWLLTSR